MPKFRVNDPESGRSLLMEGETPPSEQEIEEAFRSVTQQATSFRDLSAQQPLSLRAPAAPFLPTSPSSTTVGGPRRPLATYGETMAEPAGESIFAPRVRPTEPRLAFPNVPIGAQDTFWQAAGKEAVNAVKGLPEYFTSDAGIASLLSGTLAPRLTAAGFSADLTHSAFQQAKQMNKDWGQMTPAQKGVSTVRLLSSMGLAILSGRGAIGKTEVPSVRVPGQQPTPTPEQIAESLKATPIGTIYAEPRINLGGRLAAIARAKTMLPRAAAQAEREVADAVSERVVQKDRIQEREQIGPRGLPAEAGGGHRAVAGAAVEPQVQAGVQPAEVSEAGRQRVLVEKQPIQEKPPFLTDEEWRMQSDTRPEQELSDKEWSAKARGQTKIKRHATTKNLTDFLRSQGIDVESFLKNQNDHVTHVDRENDGSYQVRIEHHMEGTVTPEVVNVRRGQSLSNPGRLEFRKGVGTVVIEPDGTVRDPTKRSSEGQRTAVLLGNRPAVKTMPDEAGKFTYVEAERLPTGEWETHDQIIERAGLKTDQIDRRVFLDEQGREKPREQTAQELQVVGEPTKVPGEAHSTDVNRLAQPPPIAAAPTAPPVEKPAAVTEPAAKEPWQMTAAEYRRHEQRGTWTQFTDEKVTEARTREAEARKALDEANAKRKALGNTESIRKVMTDRQGALKRNQARRDADKEIEKARSEFSKWASRSVGRATHEGYVKRALEAGKPVPAEVLADYPELKPSLTPPPKPEAPKADVARLVQEDAAKKVPEARETLDAHQTVPTDLADKPASLGKWLTRTARPSEKAPETQTSRLTTLQSPDNQRVAVVSTYDHPRYGAMLFDPNGGTKHVALTTLLKQGWKPIASTLTKEPHSRFRKVFGSMEAYQSEIGQPLAEARAALKTYPAPTQVTEPVVPTPAETVTDPIVAHLAQHPTLNAAIAAIQTAPNRRQIQATIRSAMDDLQQKNPKLTDEQAAGFSTGGAVGAAAMGGG